MARVGLAELPASAGGVGDDGVGRGEDGRLLHADAPRGEVATPLEAAVGIPRVAEVGHPGQAVAPVQPVAEPVDVVRRAGRQDRFGALFADRAPAPPSAGGSQQAIRASSRATRFFGYGTG